VKAIATCIAAAAVLTACTLAPRYERPPAPVPGSWHAQSSAAGPLPEAADIGWRDFFPDVRMQRMIELALSNNRDLRVSALNVQAADAQYRIQRAAFFPTVNASGIAQAEKIPSDVIESSTSSAGVGTVTAANQGPGSVTVHYYNVGVGFTSYELDFFGKIQSLNRAALEQYFGYEETRRSSQISLIAEVASAYLVIAADRAILKITQETMTAQMATRDLIARSLDAGTSTALALRQAEITVDTALANLASYARQLEQDRNTLALLIGGTLEDDAELADDLESAPQPAELPADLPSSILTRRPDVRAAEHQLIGANADIGAARAAFFPSISLTGNFGSASSQLSGLFKHGSQAWTFAPQINLPIFAGGANLANLDLAKIQKNIYIAQYEKAIQSAFREVDDALAARGTLDEQLAAQRALVDATAGAYGLSNLRFRNGVDSFLPVLDAQRSLYSAQQGLINLQLARLQNMATLYKALGGGLKEHSESL
jgi:multidrug efflux system outer membrane protein